MDLFSMGVIDDDDRPKQHKPAPVRCLENELSTFVPTRLKCVSCLHNFRPATSTRCNVCERAYQKRANALRKKNGAYKRRLRVLQAMTRNGGWVIETRRNSRNVCDYVESGSARWGTARDLRRLGLPDGTRVAILTEGKS